MNSETPAALSEVSNEKKDASIADGPSKKDTSLMLTAQPLPPVEPRSLVVSTPPIDPQPAGATPSEVEIRAKEPPPSRPQRRLAARTPRNLQPPPPLPTEEECRTQLQARSHLFTPRDGFSYHYVRLPYVRGAKFGLLIKSAERCIFVSRVEPRSLVSDHLQVGDRLVDVDGTAIGSDRERARTLMLEALSKRRAVSFIVERPVSTEARAWTRSAILSSSVRTSSTAPKDKEKWKSMSEMQRRRAAQSAAMAGVLNKSRGHSSPDSSGSQKQVEPSISSKPPPP